jgi:hypothetical protein
VAGLDAARPAQPGRPEARYTAAARPWARRLARGKRCRRCRRPRGCVTRRRLVRSRRCCAQVEGTRVGPAAQHHAEAGARPAQLTLLGGRDMPVEHGFPFLRPRLCRRGGRWSEANSPELEGGGFAISVTSAVELARSSSSPISTSRRLDVPRFVATHVAGQRVRRPAFRARAAASPRPRRAWGQARHAWRTYACGLGRSSNGSPRRTREQIEATYRDGCCRKATRCPVGHRKLAAGQGSQLGWWRR